MSIERSVFAGMSTEKFVEHLKIYGLQPTEEESMSLAIPQSPKLSESIAHTVLEITGQKFGDAVGETSAK